MKEIEKRIMAFERKCYRKILRIVIGQYLAETDRQKTRTVWAHMQNAQQQEDKGADVWKN